jgi:D-erythro-7,8-dihydroneopterin triphosphate epimerase
MAERELDKIHIRDLLIRCIVGIYDWEREKKQDVLINITLYADLKTACQTDRIEDTIDYKAIKQKVVDMVESSSYMLVERLAERVAEVCLENPQVQRVKVLVDKTGALRFARSVGIEIVREQKSEGN